MNRMAALGHRLELVPLLTLYTLELAEIRGSHADRLREINCAQFGGVINVTCGSTDRNVAESS